MKHEIEPIASFGDIVKVTGYGDDLFAVESYAVEYNYEPDMASCGIIYDLTCVVGNAGVYTLAEQYDVTVVCKAAESEAYLRDYATPKQPKNYDWLSVNLSVEKVVNKPKPPTDRRKQAKKQDEIDGLLDKLSDLLTLHALFGGKDNGYAEEIAQVTGKLKEVAG